MNLQMNQCIVSNKKSRDRHPYIVLSFRIIYIWTCRLCTVENDRGKTFASCSEKPKDGMVIYTNTPRLMRYRKLILELLLAAHCRDCTTCIKSGECHLQELAHRMGVHEIRFENVREQQPIDTSSHAIIRDPNKCILAVTV